MISTLPRQNNLDFVRFVGALLVIYGHSATLIGLPNNWLWGTPISTIGVMVFLSISGYLVTVSWQSDPRAWAFAVKRALRILPALAVCVLLTAFVLGPVLTTLPLKSYFASDLVFAYCRNILLLINYSLPGVFEANIYPRAVNGSIWTLPVEAFCYILIVLLAVGRWRLNRVVIVIATAAICVFAVYMTHIYAGPVLIVWDSNVAQAAVLFPFFFVGSLLALIERHVSIRLDIALMLVFANSALEATGWGRTVEIANWFVIPYVALAFGLSSTPVVRRWARFGDLSYGMYLYAFPLQQTIVHVTGNRVTFISLLVMTTVLSCACGWLSWHLVEYPALQRKPRARTRLQSDGVAGVVPSTTGALAAQ